jgi:adhesin/invasin
LRTSLSNFSSIAVALLILVPVGTPVVAARGASGQAAPVASLEVDLRPAQVPISTVLNTMVLFATVTSGGQPIPNATVAFRDAFGSTFTPPTASANASGIAVTEMLFIDPNPFNDNITAVATYPGYGPANATVVVYVQPLSNQQVAITATVVNDNASGGSSEVIQGYVGTVYSSATKWHGVITGLPEAVVTMSDTIGSTFPTKTVTTNDDGFYSANFTLGRPTAGVLDIVTVSATAPTYNGSTSTIELNVNPYGPKSLTVTLDTIPSGYSTLLDYATVQAHVTVGGAPVQGVPVVFSESLNALFEPDTATTDSSGTATTILTFTGMNDGLDLFTAQASMSGYSPGAGSNTIIVRLEGKTQLSVSEALSTSKPVEGTNDTVFGEVGWVGSSTSYAWSPSQNGVAGATVTISDSLSSFAPVTVTTNAAGYYTATFPVPTAGGEPDVIEATASLTGYRGTTSSLFELAVPVQVSATDSQVNSTDSSSTPSATSSALDTGAGSSSATSTRSASATTPSSSGSDSVVLAVVAFVIVALLVLRVARFGKKRRAPAVGTGDGRLSNPDVG